MYLKIKALCDFVGASLLLVLLGPVMLMAALAIKMEAPKEPILFRQPRPGKDERVFQIYKFRTMCSKMEDETGKMLNDKQRMTKVGIILRATSIDELPQLVNILKGEMSFIGPRPLLVSYLPLYNEDQRKRHLVKPGISGWAQVNGRNATTWEDRFLQDAWYVSNLSLKVDCLILCKTVWNVLRRENINHDDASTMPFFGV